VNFPVSDEADIGGASNSVILLYMSINSGRKGWVKRNKYHARKPITKVSCRISSLRKVAEEVKDRANSETVVLVYRSAGRWCSHLFLHLGC